MAEMQTYDCTVRLSGDMRSEVFKSGVTAAEIMVLNHVHGGEAEGEEENEFTGEPVVKIKPDGFISRTHKAERRRLVGIYGAKRVKEVFGPPAMASRLPRVLKDIPDVAGESDSGDGDDTEE